jgi:S1-C subfamily serine protease
LAAAQFDTAENPRDRGDVTEEPTTPASIPVPRPEQTVRPAPPRLVWDPPSGTWRAPDETVPATGSTRGGGQLRAAFIGGAIGALLVAGLGAVLLRTLPVRTTVAVERRLSPAAAAAASQTGPIIEVAAKAGASVVNVDVSGRQASFFGTQTFKGTGSGVILRSDGYVVTNAHVVENATQVAVTMSSGERVAARVVGADPDTDIAVIKLERTGLPSVLIGSARDLKVGELAVAIGSPLGLQQTVTAGIISAVGRRVDRDDGPALLDMIQTDAAITQGNSGGALLNGAGALVGINSAIAASPTVGAEGIAFAIPVDIAKAVADELIATGHATHPWIGIAGGNIDAESARRFGVSEGAIVAQVLPGSPADRAGLKAQDIVVAIDGSKVAGMDDLVLVIRTHKVGERLKFDYVRGGQRASTVIELADRPATAAS